MANVALNTNGSQFFLCFIPCDWLDGKHVVFRRVTEDGFDFLYKLETVGTKSGKPMKTVEIVDCGNL